MTLSPLFQNRLLFLTRIHWVKSRKFNFVTTLSDWNNLKVALVLIRANNLLGFLLMFYIQIETLLILIFQWGEKKYFERIFFFYFKSNFDKLYKQLNSSNGDIWFVLSFWNYFPNSKRWQINSAHTHNCR